MAIKKSQSTIWKMQSRDSNHTPECNLTAYWEVELDPMSDDYTPQEISAEELFHLWAQKVSKQYTNGLIPILWCVQGVQQAVFESMPFQFSELGRSEDFLSYFTWPINKESGERLNWLTLPVIDKLWNRKRADKGGFIQEFTGWKPSILQPYVYLPSLVESRTR